MGADPALPDGKVDLIFAAELSFINFTFTLTRAVWSAIQAEVPTSLYHGFMAFEIMSVNENEHGIYTLHDRSFCTKALKGKPRSSR